MAQGVQCLHFNVIASLIPCHSVESEYSPTQTAKYSVIGSCKILIQSYHCQDGPGMNSGD